MSFLQGGWIVLCYSMTIKQEDVLYIEDLFCKRLIVFKRERRRFFLQRWKHLALDAFGKRLSRSNGRLWLCVPFIKEKQVGKRSCLFWRGGGFENAPPLCLYFKSEAVDMEYFNYFFKTDDLTACSLCDVWSSCHRAVTLLACVFILWIVPLKYRFGKTPSSVFILCVSLSQWPQPVCCSVPTVIECLHRGHLTFKSRASTTATTSGAVGKQKTWFLWGFRPRNCGDETFLLLLFCTRS